MIKSLSIIFPMYNETKRLFRTFDDIEKFQRRNLIKNLEYIFVDDGSSDDSIKKVLNFFKNKKKIKYKIIKIIKPEKAKNKNKLIPDTNIKASHVKKIKIVWPTSGWDINKIIIGSISKKLKKYFIYKLFLFLELRIDAIITIIKGFNNSIGWNLGKKRKSSHLFEPFTSTPINGTKTKDIRQIKNKNFDKINNFSAFKYERKNNIPRPNKINTKCLKKKR